MVQWSFIVYKNKILSPIKKELYFALKAWII